MQALREEALGVLVESINAGEISSLDGIDTPLSKQIKAYHRLVDFETEQQLDWFVPSLDVPMLLSFEVPGFPAWKERPDLGKAGCSPRSYGRRTEGRIHAAFEKAGTDVEQTKGSQLVERMGKAFAAHEHVLVCEDCNNADTEAKKHVSAPPFFSFTLWQIRRFIQGTDHQPQMEVQTAQVS